MTIGRVKTLKGFPSGLSFAYGMLVIDVKNVIAHQSIDKIIGIMINSTQNEICGISQMKSFARQYIKAITNKSIKRA
ncbi:MAG: hypothetical protein IJG81_04220 [Muribaculaceae bacterium]|nr:hypothetical protein [Muribaculaceae bacterium]